MRIEHTGEYWLDVDDLGVWLKDNEGVDGPETQQKMFNELLPLISRTGEPVRIKLTIVAEPVDGSET